MISLPDKYKLIELEQIDSTNSEAKRQIEKYPDEYLIILAKLQTNGRGRLGRSWVSLSGNLLVSIVLPHKSNNLLPFIAALAVGDTLSQFIEKTHITYKWPNDVLVLGHKICGILIEIINNQAIIGIGINIASFPQANINFPATCVKNHTKSDIEVKKILELLIAQLEQKLCYKNDAIIQEWCSSAYNMGKEITIKQQKRKISGILKGIDNNGGLILQQLKGKSETVLFGDVC